MFVAVCAGAANRQSVIPIKAMDVVQVKRRLLEERERERASEVWSLSLSLA